ncbi:Hypothetical protein A7982_00596 [Minicystis rosea]|nr:Hypothetical protein A7982_00596 [Minicystis rosea]
MSNVMWPTAGTILFFTLMAGCGSSSGTPSSGGGGTMSSTSTGPSTTSASTGTGAGGAGGTGGTGGTGGAPDAGIAWGTFERPFAADSLWNSYPQNPVLGDYQIPPTQNPAYFPAIGGGPFSTAAFRAVDTDPPMTILGSGSAANPNYPDMGGPSPVVIPHWPADVKAATGSDGHADIIDEAAGIIHSFWQLKQDANNAWHAEMYSWAPLGGSGFADPAHFSQGARASGVCTVAGLIRIHEADDGEEMFHHALAMSLDGSAIKSGFVFPATLQDSNGATAYMGQIPMGSLLMLPKDFDTSKITSPGLLKVIKTLQVYGARLVDTNTDTPFSIYVENGSTFTVSTKPPGEWDSVVANQAFDIAHALRVLQSSDGFIDGNGHPFTPNQNLNRISMRGPWDGEGGGAFDSWRQALVFPSTTTAIYKQQTNATFAHRLSWAPWTTGAMFRFTVKATGGAKINMQFKDSSYKTILETGLLGDGQSKTFEMPSNNGYPVLVAWSGVGGESSVSATLVAE